VDEPDVLGEDVVVDDEDVGREVVLLPAEDRHPQRPHQPLLAFALPIDLEEGRADHQHPLDVRVQIDHPDRLDGLAESRFIPDQSVAPVVRFNNPSLLERHVLQVGVRGDLDLGVRGERGTEPGNQPAPPLVQDILGLAVGQIVQLVGHLGGGGVPRLVGPIPPETGPLGNLSLLVRADRLEPLPLLIPNQLSFHRTPPTPTL